MVTDNSIELAFHYRIRNNPDDGGAYGMFADYLEDNNGNEETIYYLRQMMVLLTSQQDKVLKIVEGTWKRIRESNSLLIMGRTNFTSEDWTNYFNLKLKNGLTFACVHKKVVIAPYIGWFEIIKLNEVDDSDLLTLNKYTLLKWYIVLNSIWNKNYNREGNS